MSPRFGICVSHSANLIVMESLLESSNIAWHVKPLTNYHFSEVEVLHLLPNESDSRYFMFIVVMYYVETLLEFLHLENPPQEI